MFISTMLNTAILLDQQKKDKWEGGCLLAWNGHLFSFFVVPNLVKTTKNPPKGGLRMFGVIGLLTNQPLFSVVAVY